MPHAVVSYHDLVVDLNEYSFLVFYIERSTMRCIASADDVE